VGVVASAQSERDREKRSKWRAVLGVALVGVLVVAFGGAALRTRTKELELRHALELQKLASERDERLVHADKLATMGALATGIAHEVSTPLGVIIARAEQILARAGPDEKIRRSGEVIVSESERINAVVRGFLELARGGTPKLEDADPAELAQAAMNLVDHRFSKAGVTLDSNLQTGSSTRVACDARLFEQVLVNLLLNACDACVPGGNVTLSVDANAHHVAFVVTDDGAGIGIEDAARATKPFFTTKPHGTGLGLAIASEIVKHHRGSLVVKPCSAPPGTEAIVTLPASSPPPRLDDGVD
jgi:signal transduction histidine kinase